MKLREKNHKSQPESGKILIIIIHVFANAHRNSIIFSQLLI